MSISVIILTFNEEKHIKRCIDSVAGISDSIYIVDSYSTDKTVSIAKSCGAKVFQNKWENNYAKQFNWGVDNLPITTEWVLRIDADEFLLPDLIDEIKHKLPDLRHSISGVVFKRRHMFLGKWMKRGTYPVKLLRLFRTGKGRCEQRWMDEHIELIDGEITEFDHDFVDDNLNNLGWWITKHNGYSIREAVDLLDIELGICGERFTSADLNAQAAAKRRKKIQYVRQPLFVRSFVYFLYRYFYKLGFIDGKEGFLWCFLQGWWYRTLVDAKIFEIKNICGNDVDMIKDYIKDNYGLSL